MEIIQLEGLSPQLYTLLGPLVMNPVVLKENNNYPFKTTEHYQWYIGIEDNQVVGFVPVEKKRNELVINNYYIKESNELIIKSLLKEIKADCGLSAIVQTKHEHYFVHSGFKVEHRWTNYIKMIYDIAKDEGKK